MAAPESFRDVHELLHRLWSRAVGTPEYNKKDWLRFENMLTEVWRATGRPLILEPRPVRGEEPKETPRSVWDRVRHWDL